MSLDLVTLDQKGSPEKTVSLSTDLHHELFVEGAEHGFSCFQAFEDQHGDAQVVATKLPLLLKKAQALKMQAVSQGSTPFLMT